MLNNALYVLLFAVVIFILFKFVSPLAGAILLVLVIMYAVYAYIPTYWASKGNMCFNAGDFEGAVENYKKCMRHRPKVNHRINYAYMLMRTGDFDEAEKVLDFILRFKSVKPNLRNEAKRNRCMVYYKQGRLDEAIEDAKSMFNDGYKTSQLYAMLGYFMILKNPSAPETYDFCKEAYEYDDDGRDIMDNMVIAMYHKGEYAEAKKISDKSIRENPKSVEAYFHGAQVEAKLGNIDTAKKYLDKLPECHWSNMTTVSQEDVDRLKATLIL
ncbi:MAG: hypothetical protein Q4G33_02510 [bacterium]|nr:hypothetical protein [bacterium]